MNSSKAQGSPAETLENLAKQALDLTKKAKKHRKSLSGDNFYGNKLVEFRADASLAFNKLALISRGDTTALAELIQMIFATDTLLKERLAAYRELSFSLKTIWDKPASDGVMAVMDFFPLSILAQTNKSYLVSIGRQMNGCYQQEWYDACAVMMRRLLEISIIEAFEIKGIASKIKDGSDNYYQLSSLIDKTLRESSFNLSRNTKTKLPQMRDIGHMSAHGRYFRARKEDVERIRPDCRVVIEELLTLAELI